MQQNTTKNVKVWITIYLDWIQLEIYGTIGYLEIITHIFAYIATSILFIKHRWSFGIVLYEIFTIGMFQCCMVTHFFFNKHIVIFVINCILHKRSFQVLRQLSPKNPRSLTLAWCSMSLSIQVARPTWELKPEKWQMSLVVATGCLNQATWTKLCKCFGNSIAVTYVAN